MSFANDHGEVTRPVNVGSWGVVLLNAQGALQTCGTRYPYSGGVQFVRAGGLFFDLDSVYFHADTEYRIQELSGHCCLPLFSRLSV